VIACARSNTSAALLADLKQRAKTHNFQHYFLLRAKIALQGRYDTQGSACHAADLYNNNPSR
jgi:hypothetical protein